VFFQKNEDKKGGKMLTLVKNTVQECFAAGSKHEGFEDVLEALRIKEEREYYDFLMDALNVDALKPLFYKRDNSNKSLSRYVKGNFLKLSDSFGPRILKTCNDVIDFLGLDSILVDFYLEISSVLNAHACYNYKSDEPHYITFTSALIDSLDTDELRFVIGHELAHILYMHNHITFAASTLFDIDSAPWGFVEGIYCTWDFLSQLSADRVGLLAVKDFDAAVKASFKLNTGLNMKKVNTTPVHYIKMVDDLIKELNKSNDMAALKFHPVDPIRTKALEVFYNSEARRCFIEKRQFMEDKKLIKDTEELIESLKFKPKEENMDPEFQFLLSSGYLIMTGDEGWDESKNSCLLDILSYNYKDPREIVKNAVNNNKINPMFEDSLSKIKGDNKTDTTYLLSRLVPLVGRNGKINDIEIKALFDIADKLQIPEDKAMDIIFEGLKNILKPSAAR